jgi:hypothetical protein
MEREVIVGRQKLQQTKEKAENEKQEPEER